MAVLEGRAAVASASAANTATTERGPPIVGAQAVLLLACPSSARCRRLVRPRQSVALQIIGKHARTGVHKSRRKGVLIVAKAGDRPI